MTSDKINKKARVATDGSQPLLLRGVIQRKKLEHIRMGYAKIESDDKNKGGVVTYAKTWEANSH